MPVAKYGMGIFDEPVRVVPLGRVDLQDDGWVQTVGAQSSDTLHGFQLDPTLRNVLLAQDPARNAQLAPLNERSVLFGMANVGMVALIPEEGGLETLDTISRPRANLFVEEVLDDGYRIGGAEQPFDVSELGYRMLALIDGQLTLGEVAARVLDALLADPEESLAVRELEAEEHRTIESILHTEALRLIVELFTSGAAQFERADTE